MVATISRNATAEFNANGAPDGVIYIEGFRGTVSTQSVGSIGILNPGVLNRFKADYVPSKGTISAGVALNLRVDTTWSSATIKSGTAYPILYTAVGTSAGVSGSIFGDNWTAT